MKLLVCFLVVLVMSSGCNQQKTPTNRASSDIEQISSRFWSALENGRTDSLAAMVTDDFVLMGPNSEDVRGRAAFRQAADRFFSTVQLSGFQVVSREINEGDSAAYELAGYTGTLRAKGKEPQPIRGRYLMIWKRQADGTWLVRRNLFNMSSPLP